MPIHDYTCENCGHSFDAYIHVSKDVKKKLKCQVCGGKAVKVLSAFNTGGRLFKKLSGVDDTDDLTIGKIVAEGKIPAEHARPVRERISKHKKNKAEFEERKRTIGFKEDGKRTD